MGLLIGLNSRRCRFEALFTLNYISNALDIAFGMLTFVTHGTFLK